MYSATNTRSNQYTQSIKSTPNSSMSNNDKMIDLEKQISNDQESIDSQYQGEHPDPVAYYHSEPDIQSVTKIHTSSDGTFVYLGEKKYYRDEFLRAFGGTMTAGLSKAPSLKAANPAPLGLSAFALTTFVLSLINSGARSVSHDNIVAGLAMFYGGFIQLLAGMWEMSVENTFGALALSSYGGFWMSFGAISIPWFGIASAYEDPQELESAIAFYLLGWTIFTFMLVLCTLKSTYAFSALFVTLDITFILLTASSFTGNTGCKRAAGVTGLITAFIAWYNAYAGLANHENAYLLVKPFQIKKHTTTVADTMTSLSRTISRRSVSSKNQ